MAPSPARWPIGPRSVFFDDVVGSTTLSKAVSAGRIRRLAPRVYTADLASSPEEVVLANPWEILARSLPDAVVVDRSAADDGRINNGVLFVASQIARKKVSLPGLEIRVRPGAAFDSPIADSPWPHGLRMSSPARALIDNLATSRGRRAHVSRTLSRAELEDWLARKAISWGPKRLQRLHDEAKELAATYADPINDRVLSELFSQLQGFEQPRSDAGALFHAYTTGAAWDERRVELFKTAAQSLIGLPSQIPSHLPAATPPGELPFYESYFSNYIEGTEFTIEQARNIVDSQQPPADRPEDGHDILGTYRCVADPIGRAATSADADEDELVGLLTSRHATILGGRPDNKPGHFKTEPNRVGVYEFVAPELVAGTLHKSLAAMRSLPPGIARALYIMIVVTEVHPFPDGNGRVARVMMNAELSVVDGSRIVIPTVYRNEYVSGLRRVSTTDGDTAAFLRIMAHAWRWTAAMPWNDKAAVEGQLEATNALHDSTDAEVMGLRLRLP